jgi:alpha-D-ribose 1-methylphosphonate 5-triphosphate synthase subunit PhnG
MKRGRRAGLLSRSDRETLVGLANSILDISTTTTVLVEAEVGTIALQVRDPIENQRFKPADILVTRAAVDVDGTPGWAMRIGSDRLAAMAAAVCDAAAAGGHSLTASVDRLCEETASTVAELHAREWREVAPTIVAFDELDT